MRNGEFLEENAVRKAIALMHPDGELFEVRILKGKKPISGYFRDADTLLKKFDTVDLRGANVYMTLNVLDDSLFARVQSECLRDGVETTNDSHVRRYHWLFIDLDPARPSGISSSREEIEASKELMMKVRQYLDGMGFEKPIVAQSGNGYHLQYRIDIEVNQDNTRLIRECLTALDAMFSTGSVKVDTANFNPSRICKLYGTMAQKGKSTKDRSHRMARIVQEPDTLLATRKVMLEKLAATLPNAPEAPQRYNAYNPTAFDVREWMDKHGMTYKEEKAWRDGAQKLVLDECPFNADHKAPDSMILIQPGGAIAFKCLHNSCSCKTWKDVRMLYEPDAYTGSSLEKRIEEGWKAHNREKANLIQRLEDKKASQDPSRMFLTASDIISLPDEKVEYIRSGIHDIDIKCRGLGKGQVSIISGLRASGKTTVLGQIMLNSVHDRHNVACYSGELQKNRYMTWLMLQAAGKTALVKGDGFLSEYDVPEETKRMIADWMGTHFYLYDNDYGNDWDRIATTIRSHVLNHGTDLVVIDNLMTLDLGEMEQYDKYRAQKKFMQSILEIAHEYNVHIMLVAHPRKSNGFLRLEDVSGTNDIVNLVDNAFIVHRVNNDFKRLSKEMFHFTESNPIYHCSNVIEIAKDREHGVQDVFIPLFFEEATKRLRNSLDEHIVYGWQPDTWEKVTDTPFGPFGGSNESSN